MTTSKSRSSSSSSSTSHPLFLTSFKACGATVPPMSSTLTTIAIIIALLAMSEQTVRAVLFEIKNWHPILENPTHRHILARHIGVDALSTLLCGYVGWLNRDLVVVPAVKAAFRMSQLESNSKKEFSNSPAAAQARGFTYQPGCFFLCIIFVAFQAKNLVDTFIWNDGPEFIFHHILSLAACWAGLYPGYGIGYAAFFFGISELSTFVLCLLANFDHYHGIPGLDEAFPITKIILGIIFVVLFVTCRVVVWPIVSYYYTRDAMTNWKHADPTLLLTPMRKWVIRVHVFVLVGLSILQVVWLGVIYVTAVQEFTAMGLL